MLLSFKQEVYEKIESKQKIFEHRKNFLDEHIMVGRYDDIYRVQMPNITPHVCRHTYCSNQTKAGMNPKTFQYLIGHLDVLKNCKTNPDWSFTLEDD